MSFYYCKSDFIDSRRNSQLLVDDLLKTINVAQVAPDRPISFSVGYKNQRQIPKLHKRLAIVPKTLVESFDKENLVNTLHESLKSRPDVSMMLLIETLINYTEVTPVVGERFSLVSPPPLHSERWAGWGEVVACNVSNSF